MTWSSPNFLQTYDSFFNCPIGVAAFGEASLPTLDKIFYYKQKKNGLRIFGGVFGEILKIYADKYKAQLAEPRKVEKMGRHDIVLIQLIDTIKGNEKEGVNSFYMSPPICYVYSTFSVTDGHLYGPFEKLILPFDNMTWMFLISSFLVAFITIFIIYRFPPEIQHYVFGQGVYYPTLGLLKIFFGLDYVHLPERNSSRIIFMTFTIFCLIIRTGYQGKMFDLMISDPRHPIPHTVEDLLNSGIEILSDERGNIDIVER